jgi:hypothetical protein
MVVTTILFVHTTFLCAKCCQICFVPIVKPFLTHWSWLRVVPSIERGNRAHGGCDRSAGNAYSSMARDPTSDVFGGPCTPFSDLYFLLDLRDWLLIVIFVISFHVLKCSYRHISQLSISVFILRLLIAIYVCYFMATLYFVDLYVYGKSLMGWNDHLNYNTVHYIFKKLTFNICCPVSIRVKIDPPCPHACCKRRLNGVVLRMKPEKPRSRITAGEAH